MDSALEAAADFAKPFEGCHKIGPDGLVYPYHDPVGYPTQGWGRLLSRKKWEPLDQYPPITQAQADEWLIEDMARAMRSVMRFLKIEVSDDWLVALSDFAFNVGAGNLQISSLLRKVNRGEFDEAADEFLKWVYAGGVKLPGLVRRRAAEREITQ